MNDHPDLLILGTGALALLFGANLSRGGCRATLLGTWPEGLAAVNERGIRLAQPDGTEETYPARAAANPADCAGARLALVLVKAWQTERAARQLRECLAPEGVALTLQNGYGNRDVLAAELGAERVALGTITVGATLVAPGRVRVGGAGSISLERHPRGGAFLPLLRDAGFTVAETDNADSLVWSKLVINAAINPLTAILRVPNGKLLESEPARSLLANLAREAAAVAEALAIPLNFPDPVAAAENVARRTSHNYSSMYQDVLRGAPTEIDAICGAIVRLGRQAGVPVPVNEVMWKLVKGLKVESPMSDL
jgi:2-dehydropantoate 2-reductase